MTTPSRGPLPGAEHTLFGGYGPFVALLALIVAMALLAPTIAPEREVTTRPGPEASLGFGVHFGQTGVPNERQSWTSSGIGGR